MSKETKNQETLCWTCKYCTGSTLRCATCHDQKPQEQALINTTKTGTPVFQCPWATINQPVPGWTAQKVDLKIRPDCTEETYLIKECPFYEPDLEAQINSMSAEKIAQLLEISPSFIKKKHLKVSKQALYIYIRQYGNLKKKNGPLTDKQKYNLKVKIITELINLTKEEMDCARIAVLKNEAEGKQTKTNNYPSQAQQFFNGYKELLKNLNVNYRRKLRRAKLLASQEAATTPAQ